MKIGLSLAGGGIKCAACIGVLKVFEEKNIKIDMISGASAGSIVSTLYASGYAVDEIYELFKMYAKDIKYVDLKNIVSLIKSLFSGNGITISGLTKGKALENYIREKCLLKNIMKISDIKMPLFMSSVDLLSGKTYIFTNEWCENKNDIIYINDIEIATAVRASCSFPGIFEPVKWKDKEFVDGGITENIPWKVFKNFKVDKKISVIFDKKENQNCSKNMISVVECSFGYMSEELQKYEVYGSDEIIRIKTGKIGLLDSTKIDELYKIGYETAKKSLLVV